MMLGCKLKKSVFFVLVTAGMVGCTGGKNKTNIELIQGMMDQISLKAQDADGLRDGKPGNLVPPKGTIPRGYTPYPYAGNPLEAEKKLKNPSKGDFSPKTLTLGKKYFTIYCQVCHGEGGKGDGPVSVKMALKPPSLMSAKVRGFSDGRIFHIVTDGQGVMSSYYNEIRDENTRWALVNYVRSMQQKSL